MDKRAKKEGVKSVGKGPRGAPVELTQVDVDGLITGEREARLAWARRLLAAVPSGAAMTVSAAVSAGSPKAAPRRLTRNEMTQIAEGRLPDAIRERLHRQSHRVGGSGEPEGVRHEVPDRTPPEPPGLLEPQEVVNEEGRPDQALQQAPDH